MTVRDDNLSTDALAIVEKYEAFVHYLYPILQRCPRQHGVLRDAVLAALFVPIGGLYRAARSRQVSRLHDVDAEFASLRSYLRFLVLPTIKIITPHQQRTALALLAEPGKMLGAWIRKLSNPAAQVQKPARPLGQAGKL
ncbi:MAG TPA: diversity-generating retroelement protein Avd [Xanthobacteraceae bacterium]